ncbi:hypothetical protein, partial [Salmonella sp. ZJQZ20_0031]|uniref:hypothetical protein n=1 Tax=Salmonella sp. ZJQZ20_0031 TaxID=3159628 RepID=UPI003A8ADBA2
MAVLPLNLALSASHAFSANNVLVTVVDISFLFIGGLFIYASNRLVTKPLNGVTPKATQEVTV